MVRQPRGTESRVEAMVEGWRALAKHFLRGDREAYTGTLEGYRLARRNV
jgi:hypothetical protein